MNSRDKTPTQSKKFIAFSTGAILITIFTMTGLFLLAGNPAVASAIVNLLTVSLAAVSGLISIYISGQSAVDWKINSEHKSTQENTIDIKKQIIEDHKNMEMQYDDVKPIDWTEHERKL